MKTPDTLAERVLATRSIPAYMHNLPHALQVWDYVHRSLLVQSGCVLLLEPERAAERFVFDHDPVRLVDDMCEHNKLDETAIWQCQRTPTQRMWFEHTDYAGSMGLMVEIFPTNMAIVLVFESGTYTPMPACAFHTPRLPWHSGMRMTDVWTYDGKNSQSLTNLAAYYTASCLFLLNVPRLCEVRQSRSPHIVARGGDRTRTYPPVEYKRVTLTIGHGSPKYEGPQHSNITPGRRHRYHHVIGHFRTYTKRQKSPKVIWISEQWRGDAKLGILLHETHLKPPTEPKP